MGNTQSLKPGAMLRHETYRIERMLGQGGFGITYLATHVMLKKKVAIKEFFPKTFCDRDADTSHVMTASKANSVIVEKLRNKFIKEAEHIAEMDSPYIVKITDVFEENHTAYYIMDYIEGKSLSDIVKTDGPLPVEQAVEYITKIGEALTYIHSKRMNHLDVKPANIMIRANDDTPILIDFGLSKQYAIDGNQTSTTPVGISHGYAPIEQYHDGGVKEFSPQTDLYSLAATLYYMLTGNVPPNAPQLIQEDLTIPKSIDANLGSIILKAMSIRKADRYGSVSDFIKVLNNCNFRNGDLSRKVHIDISQMTDRDITVIELQSKASIDFEYVDLGLPSGIKWGKCNIGAMNPEESGSYFAWGEIKPRKKFTQANYRLSKECEVPASFFKRIIGQKTEQGYEYTHITHLRGKEGRKRDAARVILGGPWRMPTKRMFKELIDNCKWTIEQFNGVDCQKVIGPNGNHILLPFASWHDEDDYDRQSEYKENLGEVGFYWSSDIDETDVTAAIVLSFNKDLSELTEVARYTGLPIRAVRD